MINNVNIPGKLCFVFIFLFALASGGMVLAESSNPVELTGDSVEFQADEGKFVASGNVVLHQEGAVLFCDRVEFYRDRKEAHAYGDVILESDKGSVWAEKAFYNFGTKRGEFTNARIFSHPVFGQAASITRVGENYYLLSDGWLSTSDYDDPEYRIKSRRIEVWPGDKAVATSSTMYLGALPVLYLPRYTQDLRDNRPHFSVIPGYSKDFGAYLLTRYRVRPTSRTETTYHFDYRERRDVAWGVDLKYDPMWFGQGLVRTYYMNERLIHDKHVWLPRDFATVERERYRLEWRHKLDIDPRTGLIMQFYKMSDNDVLKTYFEREYREDKSPASFAVLTHNAERVTATLRTDVRTNRFEESVERLPEGSLSWSNQPIADTGFYFKSLNTASRLIRKYPSASDDSRRTVRMDSDTELSRPFKLSFLEMRPFAGTEQTYFTRTIDKADHDSVRGIFRTGMDVSTKFYRVFDVDFDRFGVEVNKLRHVLTPTVSYLYQRHPTLESAKLFSFDEVDSRAQINDITLGLDNTLQTKRKGRSVDLARSLLTSDFRLHNHERETSRGGFGPVKWQNEVYPSQYMTLHQDMTFDDESRAMETMNIDAYFRNLKNWELDIGRRFTRDDDDLLTTQLAYTFNPKWRAVIYDRWNIDTGSWQDQQYSLVRDLHSWEVELAYKDKQGYTDNSTEIWVIFRLKAFPSVMFDGGTSYNKRKVDQNAAF